jgi:16S rRNA (uracil1498-N3)-methyltransferase
MTTVLLDPTTLAAETALVEGDSYRHLFRAQRLALGDSLRAVDGEGVARAAVVEKVDRQRGFLRLGAVLPSLEAERRVELLVAPARPERASWLVEKATELGVFGVRFVASERAVRQYSPRDLERLRRVARAAVEQCGRARVPEISGPHAMDEVPARVAALPQRLLLSPAGGPGPAGDVAPAALWIGPEGGLTPEEEVQALAWGFSLWRLGQRILRIETAAIVASGHLLLGS